MNRYAKPTLRVDRRALRKGVAQLLKVRRTCQERVHDKKEPQRYADGTCQGTWKEGWSRTERLFLWLPRVVFGQAL